MNSCSVLKVLLIFFTKLKNIFSVNSIQIMIIIFDNNTCKKKRNLSWFLYVILIFLLFDICKKKLSSEEWKKKFHMGKSFLKLWTIISKYKFSFSNQSDIHVNNSKFHSFIMHHFLCSLFFLFWVYKLFFIKYIFIKTSLMGF